MMCAHGREGQTHTDFAPRHSLKNFAWRGTTLYLNPVLPFSQKEAAPRLCRPFLFSNPPPQKIRMERSGKARRRDARYSARGGIQHWYSIGAYDAVSNHHARGACEVIGSRKRFAQRI